jgi:hypothetical protein
MSKWQHFTWMIVTVDVINGCVCVFFVINGCVCVFFRSKSQQNRYVPGTAGGSQR